MDTKVVNDRILPDFRIRTFYVAAQKYMDFLKNWIIDEQTAQEAIRLLMSLYQKVENLPEGSAISCGEPQSKTSNNTPWVNRISFNCQRIYKGILDPFHAEELSQLSLAVDLGDIADDLESGISLYETGAFAQAANYWKESWKTHWAVIRLPQFVYCIG